MYVCSLNIYYASFSITVFLEFAKGLMWNIFKILKRIPLWSLEVAQGTENQ